MCFLFYSFPRCFNIWLFMIIIFAAKYFNLWTLCVLIAAIILTNIWWGLSSVFNATCISVMIRWWWIYVYKLIQVIVWFLFWRLWISFELQILFDFLSWNFEFILNHLRVHRIRIYYLIDIWHRFLFDFIIPTLFSKVIKWHGKIILPFWHRSIRIKIGIQTHSNATCR